MALTLLELFAKQSEAEIRNKVTVACWKHAKTLIAKADPTDAELKQASKLLSKTAIDNYVIAVCVLIDDAEVTDVAIEEAVVTTANKL